MAGIVEALSGAGHDVTVLSPDQFPALARPKSLRHFVGTGPRLGKVRTGAHMSAAIGELAPDVVMASFSYMAHYLPQHLPMVVDFPNIEGQRSRAIAHDAKGYHRWSAQVEATKASFWEPRVARRALACLACTETDLRTIQAQGANALFVPHGSGTSEPLPPSGTSINVVLLASGGYSPNDKAGRWLIETVWPRVLEQRSDLQLLVVGRGTEQVYRGMSRPGIQVLGEVSSIEEVLSKAAVVVAPVTFGAGAQLKVVTTLALGRTMVVTPYSLQSVPEEVRSCVSVATEPRDFAHSILACIEDTTGRASREESLAARDWSWSSACSPLLEFLESLSAGR